MIIHIRSSPNKTQDNDEVSPEDLGYSEEDWRKLDKEEKESAITEYIDGKEQIFMTLDSFFEEDEED